MIFPEILRANRAEMFTVSQLVPIHFESTRSNILRANNNTACCCVFDGLEGLFRKDREPTRRYGRRVCDLFKTVFHNDGFFTSDELPRYGISRGDMRTLFNEMNKESGDGKLIVVFAYDFETASQAREFLIDYFQSELDRAYAPIRLESYEIHYSR